MWLVIVIFQLYVYIYVYISSHTNVWTTSSSYLMSLMYKWYILPRCDLWRFESFSATKNKTMLRGLKFSCACQKQLQEVKGWFVLLGWYDSNGGIGYPTVEYPSTWLQHMYFPRVYFLLETHPGPQLSLTWNGEVYWIRVLMNCLQNWGVHWYM